MTPELMIWWLCGQEVPRKYGFKLRNMKGPLSKSNQLWKHIKYIIMLRYYWPFLNMNVNDLYLHVYRQTLYVLVCQAHTITHLYAQFNINGLQQQ